MIVAIVGIETYFGTRMGRYRVLDALATLAFAYPPRAPFFTSELESFLLLTREEDVEPTAALGSYAGAMGAGQFIPSSYRAYAVDGDADGKRDLWSNWNDVLGSVANYFAEHGWRAGEPVMQPAIRPERFDGPEPSNSLDLDGTVGSLSRDGLRVHDDVADERPGRGLFVRGRRRRLGVLGRLPQLPRRHALQPQHEIRARGASAERGHPQPLRRGRSRAGGMPVEQRTERLPTRQGCPR